MSHTQVRKSYVQFVMLCFQLITSLLGGLQGGLPRVLGCDS